MSRNTGPMGDSQRVAVHPEQKELLHDTRRNVFGHMACEACYSFEPLESLACF